MSRIIAPGGHGSNPVIAAYRKMLKDKFNIELVCQPPNSPESNVLDLGIWRSLQAVVDRLGRVTRHNSDALHAKVGSLQGGYPHHLS